MSFVNLSMYLIKNLISKNRKYLLKLFKITPKFIINIFGTYPRMTGNEIKIIKQVLKSPFWNLTKGPGLPHSELEKYFSSITDCSYAIAVGSGGVGLQMCLRVLNCQRNENVIHQVDTCTATAFAVLNAQTIPLFCDVDDEHFLMNKFQLQELVNENTRGIIATHMWGNMEDLSDLKQISNSKNLFLIEDCCLAFGTKHLDRQIGGGSTMGVFSFGSTKSIQAGGGGIIVTNDRQIALELKTLRHWGDRRHYFDEDDFYELSWNGRISEITASIALEQAKYFNKIQKKVINNVNKFKELVEIFPNFKIINGYENKDYSKSYNQLMLRVEFESSQQKFNFVKIMQDMGVEIFSANFKPINNYKFFKEKTWKKWIDESQFTLVNSNYSKEYINAENLYNRVGIGLYRNNFISDYRYTLLKKAFLFATKKIF